MPSRRPVEGAPRVARAWIALRRKTFTEPPAPIELNGRLGMLAPGRDGDRSVVSFLVDGGRIARIDDCYPKVIRGLYKYANRGK